MYKVTIIMRKPTKRENDFLRRHMRFPLKSIQDDDQCRAAYYVLNSMAEQSHTQGHHLSPGDMDYFCSLQDLVLAYEDYRQEILAELRANPHRYN